MRDELGSLTRLLPPPKAPKGLARSWSEVERELGTKLPSDYKEFVHLYGSGTISGGLTIWNFLNSTSFPSPVNEYLIGDNSVIQLYKLMESQGTELPYKLYPQPGGLLPFATHLDVHHLNWLMSGDPEKWDVIYWFSDGLEFIHFAEVSFVTFLLRCIEGQNTGNQAPKLRPPHEFKPSVK